MSPLTPVIGPNGRKGHVNVNLFIELDHQSYFRITKTQRLYYTYTTYYNYKITVELKYGLFVEFGSLLGKRDDDVYDID